MITRDIGHRLGWALVLLAGLLLGGAIPAPARADDGWWPVNTAASTRFSRPALAQGFRRAGMIDGVALTLERTPADTGTVRIEIREGGYQSWGSDRASTGIVLAGKTMRITDLLPTPNAPTEVMILFDQPAFLGSVGAFSGLYGLVLLRGANSGVKWLGAEIPSLPQPSPDPDGHVMPEDPAVGYTFSPVDYWTYFIPTHDECCALAQLSLSLHTPSPIPGAMPRAAFVPPRSPALDSTLTYEVVFDQEVAGLTAADFTASGTATGCHIGAPSASGNVGSWDEITPAWKVKVSGCSQGVVVLTLRAGAVTLLSNGDIAGPARAASARTMIDRTGPSAVTPRLCIMRQIVAQDASGFSIKITQSASKDVGGAGVMGYEEEVSTDGGRTWNDGYWASYARWYSADVRPGGSYRFRIRAVDWAGNRSAWRASPIVRPREPQESSSAVTHGSGWVTDHGAMYVGGAAMVSTRAGAWTRYRFSGRAVGVVMSRRANGGVAKIYLDGVLYQTIDTRTIGSPVNWPDERDRWVVWTKRFSTLGTHSIRVVSANARRPAIILDAFVKY